VKAILTYHSIDNSGSPISVTAERFRLHAGWLARSGIQVVTLPELAALPPTSNAVALTFDDAFVNFRDIAWPILRDCGLAATLFVVTDCAGRTNDWGGVAHANIPTLPLLDWDALGRLADEGVELGSHTRTHPNLRRLSGRHLIDEVEGAAARIIAETGRRAASFAYPYGSFDKQIAAVVGGVHKYACTTELRPLNSADQPMTLPRLDAYYFRRAGTLEAWGSGNFRRYVWLRASGRRLRAAFVAPGATTR
jgi:peptidoglycan/xylan/chitin deacetylase (PgdA/CDA1 family)